MALPPLIPRDINKTFNAPSALLAKHQTKTGPVVAHAVEVCKHQAHQLGNALVQTNKCSIKISLLIQQASNHILFPVFNAAMANIPDQGGHAKSVQN